MKPSRKVVILSPRSLRCRPPATKSRGAVPSRRTLVNPDQNETPRILVSLLVNTGKMEVSLITPLLVTRRRARRRRYTREPRRTRRTGSRSPLIKRSNTRLLPPQTNRGANFAPLVTKSSRILKPYQSKRTSSIARKEGLMLKDLSEPKRTALRSSSLRMTSLESAKISSSSPLPMMRRTTSIQNQVS